MVNTGEWAAETACLLYFIAVKNPEGFHPAIAFFLEARI